MNQGELGANVASFALGGPLAKTVGRFGDAAAVRIVPAAKYVAQGYPTELAEYLALPYKGRGSHLWPLRENPPSWFKNSEYNVWKPQGIQRGELYEGHAVRDDKFSTARVPNRFTGQSWSFNRSGLRRHDLPGAVFHGMPGPLKARAVGLGGATGSSAYWNDEERDE